MKIAECQSEKEMLGRLNNLRGVMALVVCLSHMWAYTGYVYLVPFNKAVTIAVSFFFFVSGYSMLHSYNKDNDYLRKIFRIKVPFLLYMTIFSYLFAVLLEFLLYRENIQWYGPVSIVNFLEMTNWYVWELLVFYALFYLGLRFISKKKTLIMLLIVTMVAFVILFYSNVVEAYYNSIIGFWLGMFFEESHYYEKNRDKKILPLLGIVLMFLGFAFILAGNPESILFAVIRNVTAIGAMILLVFFVGKIELVWGVWRKLGAYSSEIYFYHIPIFLILSELDIMAWKFMLISTVLTGVIVVVMGYIDRKVQRKIQEVGRV